jgi:hypothetical protein
MPSSGGLTKEKAATKEPDSLRKVQALTHACTTYGTYKMHTSDFCFSNYLVVCLIFSHMPEEFIFNQMCPLCSILYALYVIKPGLNINLSDALTQTGD